MGLGGLAQKKKSSDFRCSEVGISAYVQKMYIDANTLKHRLHQSVTKRATTRSSHVRNQLNITRAESETGSKTINSNKNCRCPVIGNFINGLVNVPQNSFSFKQILYKHGRDLNCIQVLELYNIKQLSPHQPTGPLLLFNPPIK